MENHLALIDKKSKMIKQIILVESFENVSDWENADTVAIPDLDHSAILYGSWNGKNFIPPSNEKLIALGIMQLPTNESETL